MRVFIVALMLLTPALASAQLKGSPLYQHLLKEAQVHFDARRKLVADLKTPEQIHKRQEELKAFFIASLGGFPEKTPLNAKVTGTLKADGYTVEKVIYESRPNHHVTAVFYRPDGPGPFPGVLVPCGHSANGKAAEAYQRVCILMAKNGLAVLCYDPIGQGERLQVIDSNGKSMIPGSTSEHTMVGVGALLVGRQTASYRIWDGIRSMDYLASRKEVDINRLGCTGNSGGGTLTSYLMALDDRIQVAAPSCYICSLEKLFQTLGPQDGEQNITGQVAFGMEHADFLTMRAPKPTLIAVGTYDFFDIDGAWNVFREASVIYGRLGYSEKVALIEYEDKHGFTKPRREAAMRWMRRWLLDKNDSPKEEDFPVFKDADLQCSRTGQVIEDLKGKSVTQLNIEEAARLEEKRPALDASQLKAVALKLLNMPGLKADADGFNKAIRLSSPALDDNKITSYSLRFETEPGLTINATYYRGANEAEAKSLVILSSRPAAEIAKLAAQNVRAGYKVLAIDVRGWGTNAAPAKTPAYFGNDMKETFLSLHLDRPLLGQRVYDVLSVLQQWPAAKAIQLIAEGDAGPVALHAALLEPRITEVGIEKGLASWKHVVQAPVSINQLSNAIPGVLRHYDLPELAAALAPRTLALIGPVDARGQALSAESTSTTFAKTRAAYAKHKENLTIQP